MEERKNLTGDRYNKKIDMEQVYRDIDSGKTAKAIAKDLGISRSTLYRRHLKYQAMRDAQKADVKNDDKEQEYSDHAGQ